MTSQDEMKSIKQSKGSYQADTQCISIRRLNVCLEFCCLVISSNTNLSGDWLGFESSHFLVYLFFSSRLICRHGERT